MLDHEFPLSIATLQHWFDPATFQRARAYWQAGKVVKLEFSDDLQQVSAQVWGEAFTPYQQFLSIRKIGPDWQLTDSCNCPLGGRCKHVLAVLLKLKQSWEQQAQHRQQQPLRQLSQWFGEAERVQKKPSPDTDGKDVVLYLLSYSQAGLQMFPRRVKSAKRGGYTKGQPITAQDHSGYLMPFWLDEADFRLLNQFRAQNLKEQSLLQDDWGYTLLQQVRNTGRCFFGESREPITEGQPLQLVLDWYNAAPGYQLSWQFKPLPASSHATSVAQEHAVLTEHETATLQPAEQTGAAIYADDLGEIEIIYTDPPLYIDLHYYRIGPLHTELNGRQLKLLGKMPVVPETALGETLSKLQQLFPKMLMPLPRGAAVDRIDQDAVVVLMLRLQALSPQAAPQPVVELAFDYAGHRLALDLQSSQTELMIEGRQHFVKRQRARETAAVEQLVALGLTLLTEMPAVHSASLFSVGAGPDDPRLWQPLLDALPSLRQQGWRIEQAADFKLNVLQATPYLQVSDGAGHGLQMAIHVDIEGQQVPLLPLISQWLRNYGLPGQQDQLWLSLPQGRLALPVSLIQPFIDTIVELLNLSKPPVVLELEDHKAALLNQAQLGEAQLKFVNGQRAQRLVQQLNDFDGISAVPAPHALQAQLRPYQQQGYQWLCFLQQYGLGGILADDMGLGKTLQTLSFLLKMQQDGQLQQPALVVCPTSLLGNWVNEAARFAPSLRVLLLYGQKRQQWFEHLDDYDVIVTSYPLLVRDQALYQRHPLAVMVLDEAQQIKNAGSQSAQAVRQIKAGFKVALSGTPLENHLGELKSIFDVVLPGLLGTERYFQQVFRKPIEKQGDAERAHALRRRVAPFMLRRTKNAVATELPPKTEILQYLELEPEQRNLYESIRLVMETRVRELFVKKGVAASQIEFLDALLKLRQACCDARLVPIEQAQHVTQNAKLAWLRDHIPAMVEEGRNILIFSQFASMLRLIEHELVALGVSYSKLTGQTKHRQQQIDAFQQGQHPVFLISLKAGGTGLNLTAADTVIHYDPWWNPAAEQQATDRAHRIGQDKAVFVYKLIARQTVEEKVQQLQQFKRGLADQLFAGSQGQPWQGSAQELLALFSPEEVV